MNSNIFNFAIIHGKAGRLPMLTGKRSCLIKAKLTDEEFSRLLEIQKTSGLNRMELIRIRARNANLLNRQGRLYPHFLTGFNRLFAEYLHIQGRVEKSPR